MIDLYSLQNSNEAAWRELYTTHYDKIFSTLKKRFYHSRYIEDSINEAFLDIYKSRNKFESLDHLIATLFKAAQYTAIDHIRKEGRIVYTEISDNLSGEATSCSIKDAIESQLQYDKQLTMVKSQINLVPSHQRIIQAQLKCLTKTELKECLDGYKKKSVLATSASIVRELIQFNLTFVLTKEGYEKCKSILTKASLNQKKIMQLAVDGKTISEIADTMGKKYSTVKSSLYDITTQLKKTYPHPLLMNFHSNSTSSTTFFHAINKSDFHGISTLIKETINNKEKVFAGRKNLGELKTKENLQKVADLRKEGLTFKKIGKLIGMSCGTASGWHKQIMQLAHAHK